MIQYGTVIQKLECDQGDLSSNLHSGMQLTAWSQASNLISCTSEDGYKDNLEDEEFQVYYSEPPNVLIV